MQSRVKRKQKPKRLYKTVIGLFLGVMGMITIVLSLNQLSKFK